MESTGQGQEGPGAGLAPAASASDAPAEKAREIAVQAAEGTKAGAAQVSGRLRVEATSRAVQAGGRIGDMADDLRIVSEELRRQDRQGAAGLTGEAAEQSQRLAVYLTGADADRLLDDAEDFARRQPEAVAAIGAVVGFLAARFLKASSRERYERHRARAFAPDPQ